MRIIFTFIVLVMMVKLADAQWTEVFKTPRNQQAKVLSSPNDDICWFISNMDSLFKTTDGGESWQKVIQTGTAFNPSGLFVLDENTAFKWVGGDLFKTVNGGQFWYEVFSGSAPDSPVVCMKDASTGVMSCSGQVYKTTNGGESWSTSGIIQPPKPPVNSYGKGNIQLLGDTIFIAAENSGVVYSPDFGSTWVLPANNGLSFSAPGKLCFSNTLFGLATYGSMPFIYRTLDGGNTWTTVDNSLGSNEDVLTIGTACWYIPNSADHFYVKYSDDQGSSWMQQLHDPDGFDVLDRSRTGNTLWVGSDKGRIYKSVIMLPTGIETTKSGNTELQIIEDKVNGGFVCRSKSHVSGEELRVFNIVGKQLGTYAVSSEEFRFGTELVPGIYVMQLLQNHKVKEAFKLVKSR